jgi:hypothetical protein
MLERVTALKEEAICSQQQHQHPVVMSIYSIVERRHRLTPSQVQTKETTFTTITIIIIMSTTFGHLPRRQLTLPLVGIDKRQQQSLNQHHISLDYWSQIYLLHHQVHHRISDQHST